MRFTLLVRFFVLREGPSQRTRAAGRLGLRRTPETVFARMLSHRFLEV